MCYSSQVFLSMLFGWKRICFRVTSANYFNFVFLWTTHLQLKLLILTLGFNQFSFNLVTCSYFGSNNLTVIRYCVVDYNLNTKMRATVVELNKGKEIALFASSAGPTRTFDHMIKILFMIFVQSSYSDAPSVSKIWHRLFFDRDISLNLIFDLSFISNILRASTTNISCWLRLGCLGM